MIRENPDVTLKEYYEELTNRSWSPAVKVINTNRRVSNFPRQVPNRISDPSPYKRPPAIYDNSGHKRLIEKYS